MISAAGPPPTGQGVADELLKSPNATVESRIISTTTTRPGVAVKGTPIIPCQIRMEVIDVDVMVDASLLRASHE